MCKTKFIHMLYLFNFIYSEKILKRKLFTGFVDSRSDILSIFSWKYIKYFLFFVLWLLIDYLYFSLLLCFIFQIWLTYNISVAFIIINKNKQRLCQSFFSVTKLSNKINWNIFCRYSVHIKVNVNNKSNFLLHTSMMHTFP